MLILKHITGGAEKENAVNYLTKQPPPADEYYYEDDSYPVNEQTRGFGPKTQAPIKKFGAKVKKVMV